jgi:fatty-acyl-CoA synthase
MESRTLHSAMNGTGPHGPAPGSTPTLDDLPRRFADFADLGEALDYAARGVRGFNFYDARADLAQAVTYAELRRWALEDAARLRAAGIGIGDRVALIAETSPAFASLFLGAVLCGAWPVPLPLPTSFGGREGYVTQIANQLASSDPKIVLAPADLMGFVRDATAEGLVAEDWEGFRLRNAESIAPHRPQPDDIAYLQYSSGSTRFPHGVMVTHRALLANLRCHSLGMEIQWDDRVVSWLPMYHDMGLVGCFLSPLANQISTDYLATEDFTRRPLSWLTLISRNTGHSVSYSPTFGYDICARRVGQGTHSTRFDLARWRIAGNGADMIRPEVMQAFTESFAPSGFDPHVFLPSYGLAEATLAVSLMPPGEGIVVDEVDERMLAGDLDDHAADHRPRLLKFVNCGRPVLGHEVQIRCEAGAILPDRGIGRIFVRGPSVMAGYFRDDAASHAALKDGWLDTGDMGYLFDGYVYIVGRAKDMIIINGRNYWPQDIEWAIEQLPGFKSGDIAAFSITQAGGQEVAAVLVQCRVTDPSERMGLREAIRAKVRALTGMNCLVELVAPRTLPRTSSGKLSRVKARSMYLAGTIQPLDVAA